MCPNCRAFITTSDRVCPYCGIRVGPRAIERRNPAGVLGGLIPATHFTTVLILLINVALYGASAWLSGSFADMNPRALWVLGGKLGPSIWTDHQYWRLVTAGFLHGGLMHIAFNAYALFIIGCQIEELFGTPRYLVIYFASSVAGFWLSARMNPVLSIGASAGIMGLIGAIVAFGHVSGTQVGRMIRNQYLGLLAINLVWGFLPGMAVDNWAHIGGFLAGLGIGWVAGTPIHSTPAREGMWRALAAVCVLITAYSFWLMYAHFPSSDELRLLFRM
jgi:rhomboid protease GluP